MNLLLFPSVAKGRVTAPPSKSLAHRALISAALAEGESVLSGISDSEDMKATMDCLSALGAVFSFENGALRVRGIAGQKTEIPPLCCRESGSTLRFLIPLALLQGRKIEFRGAERLFARNMSIYESLCQEKGFLFDLGKESLRVSGTLCGGEYHVRGDVSSQFLTGLFFALPLCREDSRIVSTTRLESASYLDLTRQVLAHFGVRIERERENVFFIPGSQRYVPQSYSVEGDYSNAAFLEAFSLLSGQVQVDGLSPQSLQGDRVYRQWFPEIQRSHPTIDLADCPDLGPVLIALAALFHGAEFQNTRRLKIKESDRGRAMQEELLKCGVSIDVQENSISVPAGKRKRPTAPIDSHNDHRIAMAMSLVLSQTGGELHGAECVKKSFPNYWDVLANLQIKVEKL